MSSLPKCPVVRECSSEYTYEDGALYICPECAHEWPREAAPSAEESRVVRDAPRHQRTCSPTAIPSP
jgi:protein PhnA